MSDRCDKLRRERRAAALGEGLWFRKSDRAEAMVGVQFYPTVERYITVDGERRRISEGELLANYERLRL